MIINLEDLKTKEEVIDLISNLSANYVDDGSPNLQKEILIAVSDVADYGLTL